MTTITGTRQTIELRGRTIEYAIRISRAAKRSRIRVNPTGVEVILAQEKANSDVAAFLALHADWVLAQLAYIERAGPLTRKRADTTEWTILFRGQLTPIKVVEENSTRQYAIVEAVRKHLRVRIPAGSGIDPAKAVEDYLRRQANIELLAGLAQRSTEMDICYGRLYVMAQRTKWAGCSAKGNLSFNWRLIMAPPEVMDYIIVHELAHLIERDHSTRFWFIVASHCPDYHRYKEWLRWHGEELRVKPNIESG